MLPGKYDDCILELMLCRQLPIWSINFIWSIDSMLDRRNFRANPCIHKSFLLKNQKKNPQVLVKCVYFSVSCICVFELSNENSLINPYYMRKPKFVGEIQIWHCRMWDFAIIRTIAQ